MLSWLSHETSHDQQASNDLDDESPETPAHLFPVRAFKHAIFGTPAPPKTDRRPAHLKQQSRQERPRSRDKEAIANSPSKKPGILVTPGTAGQKRKSVTFGGAGADACKDDARIKQSSDAPGQCPPTPWVEGAEDSQPGKSKPSNFTQRLRETKALGLTDSQEETTLDMTAPRSTSGKYWKGEFECYSTNTERQLKKLAKKEQVAKRFAQMKVTESQQLEEDLKYEQARAVELERKVENFRRQLESQLQGSVVNNVAEERHQELERLRKENELLRAQLKAQFQTPLELPSDRHGSVLQSPDRPSLNRATTEPTSSTVLAHPGDTLTHPRRRPQSPRKDQSTLPKDSSDIWADAAGANLVAITESKPAKPRRRQDREPLAQRNGNNTSRSSSTAANLGTNHVLRVAEEEKDVAVSRSSSTAGILGSRQPSGENVETHPMAPEPIVPVTDTKKKPLLPADRQAAARERLEKRKRDRQRVNGAVDNNIST